MRMWVLGKGEGEGGMIDVIQVLSLGSVEMI